MSLPEYSQTAKYFDAHPDLWDITDYLDLCDLEYGIAISRWRKSLEAIANDPGQAPERRKRAQLLHDKYPTEVSSEPSLLDVRTVSGGLEKLLAFPELGLLAPALGPGEVVSFSWVRATSPRSRRCLAADSLLGYLLRLL